MAGFENQKNKIEHTFDQGQKNKNEITNLKKINLILNPENFKKKIVRVMLVSDYDIENDLGGIFHPFVQPLDFGGGVG